MRKNIIILLNWNIFVKFLANRKLIFSKRKHIYHAHEYDAQYFFLSKEMMWKKNDESKMQCHLNKNMLWTVLIRKKNKRKMKNSVLSVMIKTKISMPFSLDKNIAHRSSYNRQKKWNTASYRFRYLHVEYICFFCL